MGVYLPYMVVDVNAHACLRGEAEMELRQRYIDSRTTLYDANVYNVERDFDLTISSLTIESSEDKLNRKSKDKTTNIINSIMPFDVENSVKWNSNYLKGYSSEKRDINIDELRPLIKTQIEDITRLAANKSLWMYDRGVRWDNEEVNIKGSQWKTAYLPVWLYSYQQEKHNGKKLLHYIAVNGRTKEVIGSVPVNKTRLLLLFLICFFIVIYLLAVLSGGFLIGVDSWFVSVFEVVKELEIGAKIEVISLFLILLFFPSLIPVFIVDDIVDRYRNFHVRHSHEKETKTKIFNLKRTDKFKGTREGLEYSTMESANNKRVNG